MSVIFSKELEKSLKKLGKKNPVLQRQIIKKIREILKNPEHYKPLRAELKGFRRVHFGSFVLIYTIEKETTYFISLDHHDKAY